MTTLTVLMTMYHGTSVDELERAVASIAAQTRQPDEFLIVVDGPVDNLVDGAIIRATAENRRIRVERLAHNMGNGRASARGVLVASGDFIARQDSDDVSLPNRLERELAAMEARHLDLVGTAMLEFEEDPVNIVGIRRAPTTHTAIVRRLRVNNPFNHPTVMFRRDVALNAGGYVDVPFHEDYDLWARMISAGANTANLPDALVLFSAGGGMLARRGGWKMLQHEVHMQRRLREAGVIGWVLTVRNLALRGTFRILPPKLLTTAYSALFRRDEPAFAVGTELPRGHVSGDSA
ncbi:MAG: glycosyltransferase [Ornithinibacter sp.]